MDRTIADWWGRSEQADGQASDAGAEHDEGERLAQDAAEDAGHIARLDQVLMKPEGHQDQCPERRKDSLAAIRSRRARRNTRLRTSAWARRTAGVMLVMSMMGEGNWMICMTGCPNGRPTIGALLGGVAVRQAQRYSAQQALSTPLVQFVQTFYGALMDREPKDQRVPIMVTASELKAIDDWSFQNRVRTRAEAIRQLIARGLNSPEEAKEKQHE